MNDYLEKIRFGQPINYAAFLKKLPEPYRSNHRLVFATEKISTNRWRVAVIDHKKFAELHEKCSPALSRVSAAQKGDSHRHTTGVNFLLVYHQGLASNRPDTLIITEEGVDIGFQPASQALIIENERNFYHYQQMLAFTSVAEGHLLTLANCDVILGSGNRITQSANLKWLAGYEKILCAFDYDAGGLQMFSTIAASLHGKAHFIQPLDWQPFLPLFRKTPRSTEHFTRALSQAEALNFLSLAQAFRSTGKFMEQEMILNESQHQ